MLWMILIDFKCWELKKFFAKILGTNLGNFPYIYACSLSYLSHKTQHCLKLVSTFISKNVNRKLVVVNKSKFDLVYLLKCELYQSET